MTDAPWAVLPGAGFGSRFGGDLPKQYALVNNKPVVWHTVAKLAQLPLSGIVLVVAADDHYARQIDFNACLNGMPLNFVQGGASRRDSVLAGLNSLTTNPQQWVIVHDVARPCVQIEDITQLLTELENGSIGGALACPVRDTLKQVVKSDDDKVYSDKTIDRSLLWQVFTPQIFRLGQLRQALTQAPTNITDECSAMEVMGHKPLLINSNANNIKVTYPEDLALAEYFLNRSGFCV